MGFKTFVNGDILDASEVNDFLMKQSVMVFADAAARTTALPAPIEGMVTYLSDTDSLEVFTGASFVIVNDNTAAILKAIIDAKGDLIVGTAADTPARLAAGTNEHRLVADSGETAGLKYVADTTNFAIAAKGDLLAGTAADTVSALTVGTNGQVLTADSSAATGLAWAAAGAGGGKVLQVVQGSTDTLVTVTATTFTDTGLTATITPTSATSKVLVVLVQAIYNLRSTNEAGGALRLMRDATEIAKLYDSAFGAAAYVFATGPTAMRIAVNAPMTCLDSPNTTSAVTYKVQGRPASIADSGQTQFQIGGTESFIQLIEIGA